MLRVGIVVTALEALDRGTVIRTVTVRALQVLAWITLAAAVVAAILTCKLAFGGDMPAQFTISLILVALIWLATGVVAHHVLLRRAETVRDTTSAGYVVVPIYSILCRAWGEVSAAILLGNGVASCIALWIAGGRLPHQFGGSFDLTFGLGSFLGGVVTLVANCIAAFLVLVGAYFFAEIMIVLVDIAARTTEMAASLGGAGTRPPGRFCEVCGRPVEAGSSSCVSCGAPQA